MICVLVVENDPAIRMMLREMLAFEGYRVETAEDGIAGLRVLREARDSHVVLLNYLMPELDGRGVLRVAASEPPLLRHRYILMSSVGHSHWRATAVMAPHAVLAKPFSVDQLLALIEAVVIDPSLAAPSTAPSAAPPLRLVARPYGWEAAPSARGARDVPLLLAFSPRSRLTRRRMAVIVRTRPGAVVVIEACDGHGRPVFSQAATRAVRADERGYCAWRWAMRTLPAGPLTVVARATWNGGHVELGREFALRAASRSDDL